MTNKNKTVNIRYLRELASPRSPSNNGVFFFVFFRQAIRLASFCLSKFYVGNGSAHLAGQANIYVEKVKSFYPWWKIQVENFKELVFLVLSFEVQTLVSIPTWIKKGKMVLLIKQTRQPFVQEVKAFYIIVDE